MTVLDRPDWRYLATRGPVAIVALAMLYVVAAGLAVVS